MLATVNYYIKCKLQREIISICQNYSKNTATFKRPSSKHLSCRLYQMIFSRLQSRVVGFAENALGLQGKTSDDFGRGEYMKEICNTK